MQDTSPSTARARFELHLRQVLVAKGLVAKELMHEALEQQLILGGHLSTNLWELGALEASTLDLVSGEILRLPIARTSQVLAAPREAIEALTPAVVETARALPLRVEGRALHVATCEPWDPEGLQQVAFITGKLLSLHYMGEVTVMRLGAELYGLPLSARFRLGRTLLARTGRERDKPRGLTPVGEDLMPESFFDSLYADQTGKPDPAVSPAGEAAEEHILDLEDVVELTDADRAPEAAPPSPLPRLVSAPQPLATETELEIEIDLDLESQPPPPPAQEPLAPLPTLSLEEAIAALESARDRDGLGRVLLGFALAKGRRAVLLVQRGSVWFGWLGAGPGIDPATIPSLMLPLEAGTAFGLVGRTGAPFLGPLAPNRVHRAFLKSLGGQQPRTVGLFPIHYKGRLVFGIYLDDGHGRNLLPDVGELLVLAQRTAMTLDRLLAARLGRK